MAAKAIIGFKVGVYRKRGCFFIVKRAASPEAASSLFQADIIRDDGVGIQAIR